MENLSVYPLRDQRPINVYITPKGGIMKNSFAFITGAVVAIVSVVVGQGVQKAKSETKAASK